VSPELRKTSTAALLFYACLNQRSFAMAEIEPRLLQVQALKAACSNCSVLELCLPIGLTGGEVERLA
jgi:hypothetical protein